MKNIKNLLHNTRFHFDYSIPWLNFDKKTMEDLLIIYDKKKLSEINQMMFSAFMSSDFADNAKDREDAFIFYSELEKLIQKP